MLQPRKPLLAIFILQNVTLYLIILFSVLRLELGLLSVQRDVSMIGQVYNLLYLIWKTYHFSPKSMRELKSLGAEIGVTVNAPSGVKGTRWLPHVS